MLPITLITIHSYEDKEQNEQQNKDTEQSMMMWSEEKKKVKDFAVSSKKSERSGSCWLFIYLVL